ncbi:hypothetical protein [Hyalangium rubrum]|uniref:Uncharacterized protein n=1 Tax=Hyalangium rubrum TaxID=3103134 RepID=A0ABU5GV11_9BACT|nr:hypothetical protein [Hyalangium sp. s54d21]MDY7225017.1 hypothetical protein [Hyalangium sp. s54d21]
MWSSCEAEREGYTVRTSGAADDRASSDQLAVVVVSAKAPERMLALLPPGQQYMGKGSCIYNFDIAKERGAEVALRSVDLAGNLSEPGPAIKLFRGMPIVFAMLFLSTPGRVLLTVVVLGLGGLLMLAVRRK